MSAPQNGSSKADVDEAGERHEETAVEIRTADSKTEDGPPSPSSVKKAKQKEIVEEFTAPINAKCYGKFEYGWEPWHIMPYHPSVYRRDLMQVKNELVAGLTVAFAQVSESIAFAFIAGVGPLLGLHAAWIIGLSLSLFGSRPGMINGATGVRAAVIAPYVDEYGIGHLFYIIFIISIFQLAAGFMKLAKFVRMVPRPVMIGFVNGLAIILTLGQVFQFQIPCDPPETSMNRTIPTECMANITINGTLVTNTNIPEFVMIEGSQLGFMFLHVIVVFLTIKLVPHIPKVHKYIPASLSGILVSTLIEWIALRPTDNDTPVIGEVGKVSGGLPKPFFIDPQYEDELAPFNWDTLSVCIFPAFIAAAAGAVEAVMTMEVVNDLTETGNEAPNQQLVALSIGNAISAIFGTMGTYLHPISLLLHSAYSISRQTHTLSIGGGATIGLSVINCNSGANGRYRLSGVFAGIMVFTFVLAAAPLIEIIPTASLVGVMVVVIIGTFDWESLLIIIVTLMPQSLRERACWKKLTTRFPSLNPRRKIPRLDMLVIVLVTAVTLIQDLFVAVAAGILITAAGFAWNVGERMQVETEIIKLEGVTTKIYRLHGPLFFASAQRFTTLFDARKDPDRVEVHFDRDGTDLADFSGIHALNVVGGKYKKYGKKFYVKHLDQRARKLVYKSQKLQRHFDILPEDEKL